MFHSFTVHLGVYESSTKRDLDNDVKKKRYIIGSIFPEKLTFDGFNYRTARINEAVKLIYSLDKGFGGNKNGQTETNFDLSTSVNRIGQFSNQLREDLRLFHTIKLLNYN